MTVRFYVNQFRELEAEMDGEREIIITTRFMQNENVDKAAAYLEPIAEKMTKLYNGGQIDEAEALMEEAEARIREAQTAEKFMEEVTF